MNELTLRGLVNAGRSKFVAEDANWLIVEVRAYDDEPEIIINPRSNFQSKIDYYVNAYTEDLVLKNNPNIRIVGYRFVEVIDL